MNIGIVAFLWGILSAISLPLGAVLGLWWRPKQKANSSFMAFGAGALLFALTIELFGHVPHHVENHGIKALFAAVLGAIIGGILFDVMNHILNNRGAFLRRMSNAKKYVARLKILRAKNLVEELSYVTVLNNLAPKHMVQLVHRVQKENFKKGDAIFQQGEEAGEMYFIVSGEVEIILHESEKESKTLAVLQKNDTFGELGILSGAPRSAEARAVTDIRVYKILKRDFDDFLKVSPELQKDIKQLASSRIDDLSMKASQAQNEKWKKETLSLLENWTHSVSTQDIREEGEAAAAGGAALAIWMGILIDGIPESLVIGMLSVSVTGMSLAFIAGVFLANMPEAMSSAVSMKNHGMSFNRILLMWGSICILTGVGAFLGAILFPSQPTVGLFYFVLGIEGLAAGAMLTMIAETMLPEAFEQGGAIVGLSTLAGFLAALTVKVL